MYKVFIDNNPILYQKAEMFSTSLDEQFLPFLKTNDFERFKDYINTSKELFFVNSSDPLEEIKKYFKEFKWIEAAGGLVQNSITKNYLFISRFNHWDLPKGMVENGEDFELAAIREVQEECGLDSVQIIKALPPTFHVYYAYETFCIKRTHWFAMTTEETEISPQLEEDIEEVKWVGKEEMEMVTEGTFGSVRDLLKRVG